MFTSSGFKQPKESEIDFVIICIFIHVPGVFFSDVLYSTMFLFPICPDVWWHPKPHQVAASALHGEEEEEVSTPGILTPWRSCLWMKLPISDLLRQVSTYLSFLVCNSLCVCNCAQALFMFQYMIFCVIY